jgi:hypothetical protein
VLHPPDGERLDGFDVARPRAGEQSDLYTMQLGGQVSGRPGMQPEAVEVVYHGRAIQVAPIRRPRPDADGGRTEPAGEQGHAWGTLVGLLGLRPDAEFDLHVVFENGERVPAATVRLRRAPLRSSFEPRLQPILLSAIGRSGSTWLMKVFAGHPEIVVRRHFPYESSAAKYWMHALRVMSDPANLTQSAHPDSFQDDRWWVGNNPFFDFSAFEDPERAAWLAGTHVERLARFFQETAEEWYLAVARSQGQQEPRYFAEKHLSPNFLPMLMRQLYPRAREVFLVRDFRDVACSTIAMDARRGYVGSGREAGMTDEDYVRVVQRRMATDIRRAWESRRAGAHLVRYEDMVRRPHDTVADVLGFLEMDAPPAVVDRLVGLAAQDVPDLPGTTFDAELVQAHRSPRSLEDSIGQWRERDDAFRAVLDEALGDALTAFGYEREGAGPAQSAAQPALHSDGGSADTLRRQS